MGCSGSKNKDVAVEGAKGKAPEAKANETSATELEGKTASIDQIQLGLEEKAPELLKIQYLSSTSCSVSLDMAAFAAVAAKSPAKADAKPPANAKPPTTPLPVLAAEAQKKKDQEAAQAKLEAAKKQEAEDAKVKALAAEAQKKKDQEAAQAELEAAKKKEAEAAKEAPKEAAKPAEKPKAGLKAAATAVAAAGAVGKKCTVCGGFFAATEFSKNQLKQGDLRKCKACVADLSRD